MTRPALSPEQQQRLEILREDLDELCDGADPSVPAPQIDDALLARFVRADSAYATLPRKFLDACGYALRPPESIDDGEIRGELWRLIWTMAILRLLLEHTDHLSDRELYAHLLGEALAQPVVMMPDNPHFGYHLDLVEAETEENEQLYLRYYADPETRERWAREFPATEIPPSEPCPYRRDDLLPRHAPTESLGHEAS